MNQTYQPFNPSPAYRIFLKLLIQTREESGLTQDMLAQRLSRPVFEIRAHEVGATSLDISTLRSWLRALDAPFALFACRLEQMLDERLSPAQNRKLQDSIEALSTAAATLYGNPGDLASDDLIGINSSDDIPYGVWAILEPGATTQSISLAQSA